MGEFSLLHWGIVIVIVLLFFGPSKLPQLGRSLGEAIRGFKKGIAELDEPKSKDKDITAAPQIPEKNKEKES